MKHEFTVKCTAEINNCIGPCKAYIVGTSADNWELECIYNGEDELEGEYVDQAIYDEIAEEVKEYFLEKQMEKSSQ